MGYMYIKALAAQGPRLWCQSKAHVQLPISN